MSDNSTLLFTKEILILMIVGLVFFLDILPFKDFITTNYKIYLLTGIFISFQYLRITLFERKISWLRPFYLKLFIGIINIPLFFVALTFMMNFTNQFEDYNYTGIGSVIKDILPGLGASNYNWLRSSTYFISIATLMMIVLVNFRLVYSVFAYREGPGFLKGK